MILSGLDYLLAGVLAINTLAGFRKGMLRALGGIAGVLLAIVVAGLTYKELAFWLQAQWGWQGVFARWIVQRLPVWAAPVISSNGGQGMTDPVYNLSYLLLLIASFLIILVCVGGLGQVVIEALHRCLEHTPLSGLNHLLGMAVGFLKTLLILTLLVGLIYPAAQLGAAIGWDMAGLIFNQLNNSKIAAGLLLMFNQLPAWLGLNA